ncbi:hypothetical protein GOODEAATRI_029218 [Goodea atripinnis]|uniref:Uncharacterized protein n=1 Tax=Goodea atripinnis TaxID=208336 RepID=A0ABV0N546_9TELE
MCPPCLVVDHLREALADHACSNCSVLPRAVRLARLSSVEQPVDWAVSVQQDPLPLGQGVHPRNGLLRICIWEESQAAWAPGVGHQLSTELAQMKALLQSLQADGSGSGASLGGAGEPVSAAIKKALGRLQLDVPLAQPAPSTAFFRCRDAEAAFVVPPSAEYVQQLHACWTDTRAFSRPTADGRALAAMHEAPKFGLGCMPPVESAIASLIVPPDEALRPNARCSRPQCRVTDDLLCRAYDSGPIGNSLSHLMLSLSSSLELVPLDQSTQGLLDASLQAFTLMTRELGRTLSMLVHARRQVSLAQSPLTEPCRRMLRALPVVLGELFGSAALEALERTSQASRTWQQLAGFHRPPRRPVAGGAAGGLFRGSLPPPVPFLGSTSMAPRPRPGRAQGDRGGAQGLRPVWSGHSGRRFPRPSGGQGARR